MRKILAVVALGLVVNGCGSSSPTAPPVAATPAPTPAPTAPPPLYVATGSGDTVFDIPRNVTRIKIEANYPGRSTNFIVKIAGRLVVNELLGPAFGPSTFTGTYLIAGGGTVEITNSSGVNWSFTEVR